MNNLKRVLSLALSGIMLVGMMAMGASAADFTDADTIVHQDAVDILVALDIINGQDDGSFNPQGNVTRAQMAKMIAVAMKGGNDVSTGTKGTASFTDIKGHWAESYIEYCYDLGIISGRGDGTFAPDDNVTGIEATKMVLTALGYDSEAYKLTGASWATRADELARQADPQLYEELAGVVLDKPASRDTAAQLIWNGLQNSTKIVTPTTNTSTGEVSWRYDDGPMMLTARYNGLIVTGTFRGNKATGITACEKGEISVGSYHFPADIDLDYIGEEVRVIYKNGVRSNSAGPDKNDTIYGVFLTGATNVIRTTRDKLDGVKSTKDLLSIDGTEYEVQASTETTGSGDSAVTYPKVTVNTNLQGDVTVTDATAGVNDDTKSVWSQNIAYANGDAVKVILNDMGKVAKLYFTTSKLGMVTNVTGDKVTINGLGGTIKISENDVYDGVAKDDVVTFTTYYKASATTDGAYTVVEKAEVTSGTLKAYKLDSDGDYTNVTVDDTAIKVYHPSSSDVTAFTDIGLGSKKITTLTAAELNVDVDAYLVNGFVAAIKKTSTAATNYSVILEIRTGATNNVFGDFQLYVMDGEGTKTIITLNDEFEDPTGESVDLSDTPASQFHVGDIITYTLDKNNKADVKVEKVATATTDGYVKSTKSIGTAVTATDAVIFVMTKGNASYTAGSAGSVAGQQGAAFTIKAYKASSLGDVSAEKGSTVVTDSTGKIVAAFLAPANKPGSTDAGEPDGATDDSVYGIITAVGSTTKIDGSTYTQYTVSVDGESRTVNVKESTPSMKKAQIVKFAPTSDNTYSSASKFALEGNVFSAYVEEYDADRRIITSYFGSGSVNETTPGFFEGTGSKTYAVSSDVKIYAVDKDAPSSSVGSAGSVTAFNSSTGKRNVILVLNSAGDTVNVIIVETSGQENIDKDTPNVATE